MQPVGSGGTGDGDRYLGLLSGLLSDVRLTGERGLEESLTAASLDERAGSARLGPVSEGDLDRIGTLRSPISTITS